MPGIFNGANPVTAIYRGDALVSKVYLGDLQVFPAAGGGSESHRYWKFGAMGSGAGYVSAGELWLQAGGVDLGPPITYAASSELDGGSVGSLCYDGSAGLRWMTNGSQDGSSAIAFDYGAPVAPDAIRLQAPSADPANRTIQSGRLYWSDDGLTGPWTVYNKFAFGGGWGSGEERIVAIEAPPPFVTGGARYWAVHSMEADYGGGFKSIGEMAFRIGGVDYFALTHLDASPGYDGGSLPDLAYDGNPASRYMTSAGSPFIQLDFGGPVNPDELWVKAPTSDVPGRTITGGVVAYSDDGVTWTDVASFTGWPGSGYGDEHTATWTPIV